MSTLSHNSIFASYSSPASAPAPSAERVVHSTMFSAYAATASSIAVPALAPAHVAPVVTKRGLSTLWDAWRAARKSAREVREMRTAAYAG